MAADPLASSPELPFDRVLLGPAREAMTAAVFLKLPLTKRVRHILAQDVHFFAGEQEVPLSEALRALRTYEARTIMGGRGGSG